MNKVTCEVAVLGGGPAGLSAACSAAASGAKKVLLIERDRELGGILQQCIHNGFGLHQFGQELTGPGYADRYIKKAAAFPAIQVMLDSTVLSMTPQHLLHVVDPENGVTEITAAAIVLAMGCRERARGAIQIPGHRPAGIFTAGAAQHMVNMDGYLPGHRVVILGSGDIGLIMARRLTLEGAQVVGVFEIMPHSNGLTRNLVQCLEDYQIPLYLSHTITAIHGQDRVTGVTCAAVNEKLCPCPDTEFFLACDCLLLSVGLIPENELSRTAGLDLHSVTGGPVVDQNRQASLPGFFAAGNVVHVHDLVDLVSWEGEIAGRSAARYAASDLGPSLPSTAIVSGAGIRSVVPHTITQEAAHDADSVKLFIRAQKPAIQPTLTIYTEQRILYQQKVAIAKPSEMLVCEFPLRQLLPSDKQITVKLL